MPGQVWCGAECQSRSQAGLPFARGHPWPSSADMLSGDEDMVMGPKAQASAQRPGAVG